MKCWLNKTLLSFFSFFFSCSLVYAGPYLDSAHGNSSYGVKRSITELSDYARGNCAHCHEMHASIGGAEPEPASGSASPFCLFADNFRFSKKLVLRFSPIKIFLVKRPSLC